jgi:hypothetical protein
VALAGFGPFLAASAMIAVLSTGHSIADQPTLQERCEWQARHSFRELEYEVDSDAEFHERSANVSMDYSPHYNAAIGRCLVLIEMSETSPSQMSHTAYIVDADKPARQYAFYREIGGVLIVCELRPSWGVVKFCADRDNFDAFIARYMEQ